jgi:hypothetical protein
LKRGEVAVRRRVKMPKFAAKYENGYAIQEKLFPNGKENFRIQTNMFNGCLNRPTSI